MIIQVCFARHPEKDPSGQDAITPHGAEQAFAAALNLKRLGYDFDAVYHSGINRANQAAKVMGAALGVQVCDTPLWGLDFRNTVKDIFGDDKSACLRELRDFDSLCGGTALLTRALDMSQYARKASEIVAETILDMARKAAANHQRAVLGVSHSPWFDAAAIHEGAIYGVPEAAAIIWMVSVDGNDAEMVESIYIEPPLPGKRN